MTSTAASTAALLSFSLALRLPSTSALSPIVDYEIVTNTGCECAPASFRRGVWDHNGCGVDPSSGGDQRPWCDTVGPCPYVWDYCDDFKLQPADTVEVPPHLVRDPCPAQSGDCGACVKTIVPDGSAFCQFDKRDGSCKDPNYCDSFYDCAAWRSECPIYVVEPPPPPPPAAGASICDGLRSCSGCLTTPGCLWDPNWGVCRPSQECDYTHIPRPVATYAVGYERPQDEVDMNTACFVRHDQCFLGPGSNAIQANQGADPCSRATTCHQCTTTLSSGVGGFCVFDAATNRCQAPNKPCQFQCAVESYHCTMMGSPY